MDSVAQGLEKFDLSDRADSNETNENVDSGDLVAKEHVPNSTPNDSNNAPGLTTSRLGPNN